MTLKEPMGIINFRAPMSKKRKLDGLLREAAVKVARGEIKQVELERLSDCLRDTLNNYIERLESFLMNGTSMRQEVEV